MWSVKLFVGYILVHKLLTLQFAPFKSSSVNQINLHRKKR